MKNIQFIAWQDVRNQLREGSTLLWLFIMPPIFFYFIGTVTSGFSSGMSGGEGTPVTVIAANPGFSAITVSGVACPPLMPDENPPVTVPMK